MLLTCFESTRAYAQAVEGAACDSPLELRGASAEPETEHVTFSPDWKAPLAALSACVLRPENAGLCVRVRGQFDDLRFAPAVQRALGSQRAAQAHRARARAESVLAELYALGLPPERMVSVPPPQSATYRGVEVTVSSLCPTTTQVVEVQRTLEQGAPPGGSTNDAPAAAPRDGSPSASVDSAYAPRAGEVADGHAHDGWFIGAGAVGGLMAVSPNDLWHAGVRAEFGYLGPGYVRAFVGLAIGDQAAQKVGFDVGIAGGLRPLHWFTLGLLASHRTSSHKALKAWMEQTYGVGLEFGEALIEGRVGSLWFTQTVMPLSFVYRRASFQGDALVDTRDVARYAPRVEIGLAVRGLL